MIKDNRFGPFLYEKRIKMNISQEELSYGICDASKISRIENGSIEADKILKDFLLARLGIDSENYENFLYYNDYQHCYKRQEIVNNIRNRNYTNAKMLLENYQKLYSMENPLEYQFFLTMQVQIQQNENVSKEEIGNLYWNALRLTMPEPEKMILSHRALSLEEMTLYLEYRYYTFGNMELDWYPKFLAFLDQLLLDKVTLAKIYPKATYYFLSFWKPIAKKELTELYQMLELCNKAIEMLRYVHRTFYLIELLEIKEWILQLIIKLDTNNNTLSLKKCRTELEQCQNWRNTLTEIYERYEVSSKMTDNSFLYVYTELYCIGDVIRIRRKMLGMTIKELSDGICSERTISRLERNQTEPQIAIVRLLFKRLNIVSQFCHSDLITENHEALHLFAEAKRYSNNWEYEKVEVLLEQVKQLVSLKIPENRQALDRSILICQNQKKPMPVADYIKQQKQILEYTIPYETAIASGEKYLTTNEISCLQNIIAEADWSYPEMEQCINCLYDLLENQREMDNCFNVYSFVIKAISSELGNKSMYDLSDALKIKMLKNTLSYRIMYSLHIHLYGLLWNDKQRRKELHHLKYNINYKEELIRCIHLADLNGNTERIPFYKKMSNEDT